MKTPLIILIFLAFISSNGFAQNINQKFFQDTDSFLKEHVENELFDYAKAKNSNELKALIASIENADLSNATDATKKAFYINAYNLHVINAIAKAYPITSVQSIAGFFDKIKVTTAGESFTLNNLEKERLLTVYQDARLHFVLVCGALDCPPITNVAYQPELLEQQLDQQTKLALDNTAFLKVNRNELGLSQIFKWYPNDFGGNPKGFINFINQYKTYAVPTTSKISYYDYDWTLNGPTPKKTITSSPNPKKKKNANRYVVSSTIAEGSIEVKIFNNLYTQQTGSKESLTDRATFFTTALSFLYGLNNRFNIGVSSRYRRVDNDILPSSALGVFNTIESGSSRQGLTAIGPQIRYAPIEQWSNFSIQSEFVFSIGKDLAGSATQPYIDWTGASWNTRLFNDLSIGSNFSLFTELSFFLEDIGSSSKGHINRFSTPATLIFSYSLNPKTIFYTLGGFSPFWQEDFNYFTQVGVGAKYQFTPKFELELLVTDFSNNFLNDTGGKAATYNIGIRFNR